MDDGADFSPVENYFGIWDGHIDTAVRHGSTEVAMPVGAVDAIVTIKVHGVGNVGKVIIFAGHESGL